MLANKSNKMSENKLKIWSKAVTTQLFEKKFSKPWNNNHCAEFYDAKKILKIMKLISLNIWNANKLSC